MNPHHPPLGFRPAFLDEDTGEVYASTFPDGRTAPLHVPPAARVVAGFVRNGRFYTRDEALGMIELLG